MLELVDRPQVAESDRHLPDGVRAFLMASERRIIVHCQSLLKLHGLSGEEAKGCTGMIGPPRASNCPTGALIGPIFR